MPSTISFVVSMERASSTVIVPSLPTLSMHSAMILPISVSPFAEIVATCSISLLSLTSLDSFFSSATTVSTALSMPRLMYIGDETAVTLFRPSLKMDSASTVAVVVPDLLGHAHAVLRDGGRAPLLVEHDVAAARSERHLHGLGEDLHALHDLSAGLLAEQQHLGSHWTSEWDSGGAAGPVRVRRRAGSLARLAEHAEDLVL